MNFQTTMEGWNRFWYSDENPKALPLLRIAWGIALVQKFTGFYGLFRFPNPRVRFPRHEFKTEPGYPIDSDGFSPSYPFLGWIPQPSLAIFQAMETALLILSVFFLLGLAFRITGPLTALFMGYSFLASPFFYHHHTFQMMIVTAILGFSPCVGRYSLDAIFFNKNDGLAQPTVTPRRLIQVLVTLIYFFTSISKWNEPWLSGQMIEVFQKSGSLYGPFTPWILDHFSFQALGLITVGTESFLVFGLWVPRLRIPAILAGIGLHIGIDMMMAVGSFSYQMIALYVAFLFDRKPSTRPLPSSQLISPS